MLHIRNKDIPVIIVAMFALFLSGLLFSQHLYGQINFLEQKRPVFTEMGMGLLTTNATRTIIDLNGEWRYKDTASEEWHNVSIPSSWKGTHRVVFRKTFDLSQSLYSTRTFQLVALSISNYCEITVNGQFVGKHAGLTSFSFNLSQGVLRAGSNVIEVFVHNELNTKETLPPYEQLWSKENYGGIVHDIALIARQGVWVQESYIKTTAPGEGKSGMLAYRAFLNSGKLSNIKGDSITGTGEFGRSIVNHQIDLLDPTNMQVLVVGEGQRVVVESDRLKEVNISISVPTVRLWSPESPNLYLLRQRTYQGQKLLDESFIYVGFKNVQLSGTDIYLNGEKCFLKAATYMEDSPRHGRSLSVDEMEKDVLLLKNLGVNAVRLFSGSVHPYFLLLCDRYGLLVLHELPMTYGPAGLLEKKGIQTTARNTVRELLARDNWHPSFLSLGIGQGLENTNEVWRIYLKEITGTVKRIHETYIHASFMGNPPTGAEEILDFVGIDMPFVGEEKIIRQIEAIDVQKFNTPVVITSLMYPVEIGNYNGYSDPRSIDAQAQFYLNVYNVVIKQGFAGITVHSFSDWSVVNPVMTVDRVHQYTATAGIVDRFRQKRLAYDILKACFNNEKPPTLVSGTFTEEHPVPFVAVGIAIIFLFALVYNIFRRFRENVVRSFLRPYNFYADVRDKRMLSIFQTTMVGLLGSLSAGLLFSNFLFYWRTDMTADHIIAQMVRSVFLKQWLNFAAWNPLENMLLTAMALFVILLLFTVLLRAVGLLFRRKVLLFDAYSVAMWSTLPMILLSPLGMILYRIMSIGIVGFVAIIVYVGFHIWTVSRLLKGSAIVYDVRPAFFGIAGYVLLIAAIAMWFFSLNSAYDFFSYLRYFALLWSPTAAATS